MVKLLSLQTVQTSIFKIIVETLKEILTDVNIEFSRDYIKIVKLDVSLTVLVNMKLETENFEKYECNYTEEEPLSVGVNIFNLFKLLKTIGNDDILSLIIDSENSGILEINIENDTKNSLTRYSLNLIEVDEKKFTLPEMEFESIVTFNASSFQKIIKDCNALSDTIEIKTYNNQLIFSCMGDFAAQETIIGEKTDDIKFDKCGPTIVQGCFLIKYLMSFIKFTNLSNNIKIFLKNDYPLIVKYTAGNLGEISLLVAIKS